MEKQGKIVKLKGRNRYLWTPKAVIELIKSFGYTEQEAYHMLEAYKIDQLSDMLEEFFRILIQNASENKALIDYIVIAENLAPEYELKDHLPKITTYLRENYKQLYRIKDSSEIYQKLAALDFVFWILEGKRVTIHDGR